MGRLAITLLVVIAVVGTACAIPPIPNLNDQNSSALVSAGNGVQGWWVDGTNHLNSINWFFRVGSTGGELPLGALGGTLSLYGDQLAVCDYVNQGLFDARVSWLLTGGAEGSGTSDLAATLRLTNTSQAPLSVQLFQCSDFDLNGEMADDYGKLVNNNVITQWDSITTVSESVISQQIAPSGWYLGPASTLWGWMNDDLPTTLPNTPAVGTQVGPDNLAWAFQWAFDIPAGGMVTVIISKDILIHSTV
ncbi:MAG: hypothetical protein K6U00_13110, partial [Armatimonadetes bacterium]|nr:hypothetical protein [Armatimonadota bacterium]